MTEFKFEKILLISVMILFIVGATILIFKSGIITGNVVANTNKSAYDFEEKIELDTNYSQTNNSEQASFDSESLRLIDEIISLKRASDSGDVVGIANQYYLLDSALRSSSHSASWVKVADCAYTVCAPSHYLDLINSVVLANLSTDSNKNINSLINTIYLWNSRNEALFSKAIVETNAGLLSMDDSVRNTWFALVKCNGCTSLHNDSIHLIELIIDYYN